MRILCSDSGADLAKSLEEKDVQHEITLHTLLDKVRALLLDTSQDLQPHWMTHHGCASRQTHHQIVGVHVLGAHPIRPETTRHITLPTGLVERCAAACTILIKTVCHRHLQSVLDDFCDSAATDMESTSVVCSSTISQTLINCVRRPCRGHACGEDSLHWACTMQRVVISLARWMS